MTTPLDGDAIVWCDGAFGTPNGKTAHGLVRFTHRYRVRSVVDQRHAGQDAGAVLDGEPCDIPVVATLAEAMSHVGDAPCSLVVGIAPDGGRLTGADRQAVRTALERGMNVDCGLHDFLSEDPELAEIARRTGARIRDIRKPPPVTALHHFSGRIEEVRALKVAVLGTDSAVGKRTTAVLLTQGLRRRRLDAEMIGTGQTAWMQGWPYGVVMDSLINDFVAGELEHAVLRAWDDKRPDAIVIEGQGSLMNPAYPGGFEILAATRPDAIVLQHAPARLEYDGFPGYPIQPIETQIQALELIGGRPVVAITVNHEDLDEAQTRAAVAELKARTGLPCAAPLRGGLDPVIDVLLGLERSHP